MPEVMLGGIPIRLHSGAVQQEYTPLGGVTRVRRSSGALVIMRHWDKTAIVLRGMGWMGPGLSGLDFNQPLELRCTAPLSVTVTGLSGAIVGHYRDDDEPWALAFTGHDWVPTDVFMTGNSFVLVEVPGALQYQVLWRPVFEVSCERPGLALDPANATFDWTITAEEV
ncbi:hypothetical protein QYE80_27220 [Pseudomonas tohonis]|nr:hypothetical protein L682_10970 [Pseudomonas alcaligenes OT 69]MDN4148695.1 hypothetical protein [Pseudomonas tohonis]